MRKKGMAMWQIVSMILFLVLLVVLLVFMARAGKESGSILQRIGDFF